LAEVEFRGVTRRYPGDVVALKGLDLTVPDGEFLILGGRRGAVRAPLQPARRSDKPTTARSDRGKVVNGLTPGERDIAMVFQNYALYPHMSVYRNLAYGLRQRRTPRAEIARRSARRRSAEIGELLDRKPGQLSGGQRQRVAMGRSGAQTAGVPSRRTAVEPDAKLRNQVRGDSAVAPRASCHVHLVTHDQVEAMTLGRSVVRDVQR
jgi:sn-glycerol 3-phosphate transport system ATP-binding protein